VETWVAQIEGGKENEGWGVEGVGEERNMLEKFGGGGGEGGGEKETGEGRGWGG